jgi:hypothetical protein
MLNLRVYHRRLGRSSWSLGWKLNFLFEGQYYDDSLIKKKGSHWCANLMLILAEMQGTNVAQREIWVPTDHWFYDRRRPLIFLIDLAGRSNFCMHTDLECIKNLWNVTLCHWTSCCRRFGGSCCLHRQGQAVQGSFGCLTMKMQTSRSFETSGTTHPMTQRHTPKLHHEQNSWEHLSSHILETKQSSDIQMRLTQRQSLRVKFLKSVRNRAAFVANIFMKPKFQANKYGNLYPTSFKYISLLQRPSNE